MELGLHLCHHTISHLIPITYPIWSSPTTSPSHLILTLRHTILPDPHFAFLLNTPSSSYFLHLVFTLHHDIIPTGPYPPPHHPNWSSPSTTPSKLVLTLHHHTIDPNWSSLFTTPSQLVLTRSLRTIQMGIANYTQGCKF